MSDEKLADWQVDANREEFIRNRAAKMAAFAARSPCLSFDKYFEFIREELNLSVKWLELPAYYSLPYGADGVCPVDWDEFYQTEREIEQRARSMGQSEYDKWRRGREEDENEMGQYNARRNAEINQSLAHHRQQIRRHSGRTTKQQKEHERSGNYPW